MYTYLKNMNFATNVTSFFIKLCEPVLTTLTLVKLKYKPLEEYQLEYVFNDTERHCPKSKDEIDQVRSTVYDLFEDIKDSELFRAMLSEINYAMVPSCKGWHDGNVMVLPDRLDAPFSNVITECADRISTTYWVLWYSNNVEVIQPHQNRGIFRTMRESIIINDKPDPMPDGVIAAAQVTLGVIQTSDNVLKGFQWKLYR